MWSLRYESLRERNFRSVGDGILLGDSGYACMKYLITPYLRPSTPETNRMLALSDSNLILLTQLNVKYISGACAVLHNLAIIFREPLIDEDCDVDGSFQGLIHWTRGWKKHQKLYHSKLLLRGRLGMTTYTPLIKTHTHKTTRLVIKCTFY